MQVTILGSGTSTGVPVLNCPCAVCRSKHPRNKRLRASIWIEAKGRSILVDTSTDLRQQAMRAKIRKLDAVLFTHPHADHTHGIDELRCYTFYQKEALPIYGNAWTCGDMISKFPYIFRAYPGSIEGGAVAQLQLNEIDSAVPSFDCVGVPVTPISLKHGSKECLGYRIDSVAYVTDCSYIPAPSLERMKGLSVLILDCVRIEKHPTHFNLEQALDVISQVRPKKTFLTHLGHDFDHVKWSKKLPKGVQLAYDGLRISA